MLKEERKEYIKDIIVKRGGVSINDLSKELGVSPSTIRRDLESLVNKKLLKRIHGGAISRNIQKQEYDLKIKIDVNVKEKRAIALEAVKLINENDVIFIEMSTTTMFLCELLSIFKKLTIITNGCPIVDAVLKANPDIDIYLTGGYLKKDTHVLMGHLTDFTVGYFNFSKAFLGITAIDLEKGLTSVEYMEAHTKRIIIESSPMTVGLADNSKFGNICMHSVCSIRGLNILITDSNTEKKYIDEIVKIGVSVITTKL